MKRTGLLIAVMVLAMCLLLVSCNNNTPPTPQQTRDDNAWFTQEELKKIGLDNLNAPTGLTGELTTYDSWMGKEEYAFFQSCPSKEIFEENVQIVFNYIKANYEGYYGVAKSFMSATDNSKDWYKIKSEQDLESYYSNNPSDMYTFYYVTDKTLDGEYFVKESVYRIEIRYEKNSNDDYQLKLFIKCADTLGYGSIECFYKMA